jgi:hypothetical protein
LFHGLEAGESKKKSQQQSQSFFRNSFDSRRAGVCVESAESRRDFNYAGGVCAAGRSYEELQSAVGIMMAQASQLGYLINLTAICV